jgi:hypothetical protein
MHDFPDAPLRLRGLLPGLRQRGRGGLLEFAADVGGVAVGEVGA